MAGDGESGQRINFGGGDKSRLTALRIIEDMGNGMTLAEAVEFTIRSGEAPDLVEVLRFIMLESGASTGPGGALHYAASSLLAKALEQASLWDTAREAHLQHLDPRDGHNIMMQRGQLAEELQTYAQQLGQQSSMDTRAERPALAEGA